MKTTLTLPLSLQGRGDPNGVKEERDISNGLSLTLNAIVDLPSARSGGKL
jgi:hypothetical protein